MIMDNKNTFKTSGSVGRDNATIEQLQDSLNIYRYENALIKTELGHILEKHSKELKEVKLKYELRIQDLEQRNDETGKKLNLLSSRKEEELKKLFIQNCDLQHTQQNLQKDLEAAIDERETALSEKAYLSEQIKEQLSQSHLEMNRLKTEKLKLVEQVDNLKSKIEKESKAFSEALALMNTEKAKTDYMKDSLCMLENEYQKFVASSKQELVELKLEKDNKLKEAHRKIEEVALLLNEEKSISAQLREQLVNNMKEAESNLQKLKDQHAHLVNQNAKEFADLRKTNKNLEFSLSKCHADHKDRVDKYENEVSKLREKLLFQEAEKNVLEVRLKHCSSYEAGVNSEKAENKRLHKLNGQLSDKVASLTMQNEHLISESDKLKKRLTEAEEAVKETIKSYHNEQRILEQRNIENCNQYKNQIQQADARISSLENQISERSQQFFEEKKNMKQKLKTYAALIRKLRHKLELCCLKEEQLIAQCSALKHNVLPEEYHDLQRQFQELNRKHQEFSAFLRGLMSFSSNIPQFEELSKKVTAVNEKITELENAQQTSMSEMEYL